MALCFFPRFAAKIRPSRLPTLLPRLLSVPELPLRRPRAGVPSGPLTPAATRILKLFHFQMVFPSLRIATPVSFVLRSASPLSFPRHTLAGHRHAVWTTAPLRSMVSQPTAKCPHMYLPGQVPVPRRSRSRSRSHSTSSRHIFLKMMPFSISSTHHGLLRRSLRQHPLLLT